MFNAALDEVRAVRLFRAGLMVLGVVLLLAVTARGQVSKEEHEKHHPGQGAGPPQNIPPAGPMQGMMDGMMGKNPPKEQYPSLMNLPELTPERREEILGQAHSRMQEGTALLSKGLDQLAQAAEAEDNVAMQEALVQVREGLSRLESGLAARRAIAEGKAPRDIALQWFKREMNLLLPTSAEPGFRLWGMTLFHTTIMGGLILFAATMLAMYFFKMQRAANLLQSLTGGAVGEATAGASTIVAPSSPLAPAPSTDSAARADGAAAKTWSGKLRISQIFQETANVKTFRLMNPLGGSIPFQHLPGQFLTVTVAPGGKPVKRSYTMACSPTQHDCIEITVKREEPGLVSDYLHDIVKPGDLLEIAAPSGSFIFTGREAESVVLIGGGVGITPLMSVVRYLTDRSWSGDIFLLYGVHKPQDFIFRDELEYLQRRHPNLHLAITVSDGQGTDWKGPTGRITKEFISEAVPEIAGRRVHICGPVPMMEAVKKMLAELGVPKEQVKTEAFGPALGKPVPEPRVSAAKAHVGEDGMKVAFPTVTFVRSEKAASLPPNKVILDVADEVGVEIDNSCRVGTCGTCRVKLLSGSVTMEVEDGLELGDKKQGIILACQARSTGNVTVEA